MYLACDFLFVKDIRDKTFEIFTVMDMATLFHLAVRVPRSGAREAFEAFRMLWLNWAGPPEQIILDPDPRFLGVFRLKCERLNIDLKYIAAEAHWQLGRKERHNHAYKECLVKVIDEMQLEGEEDIDIGVVQMNFAKNTIIHRAGCSPAQAVMGRQPRVPEGLLSSPENLEMHNLLSEDVRAQRDTATRVRAINAISSYEYENHLKRAELRKGAPYRGDYEPGERIAFFRKQRGKDAEGKVKPPAYQKGTIVGPQGKDNYWVSRNGRLRLCSKEQIRALHGTELWAPRQEDLDELQEVMRRLEEGEEQYEDIREEGVPDVEASIGLDQEVDPPDEEPVAAAVTPLPDGSNPEERDPGVTTAPVAPAIDPPPLYTHSP